MTKRMISILLILSLACSMLTACGNSQDVGEKNKKSTIEEESSVKDSEAGEINTEDDLTFGMIVWSKDDALSSMIYSTVNYTAECLGVKMQWEIGWSDVDLQVTQAQNLIAAGVDGLMLVSITDGATDKISELCEEAGISFVLVHRRITDDVIKERVEARSTYIGSLSEDYVVDATNMMDYIASLETINKVGLSLVTVGSSLESKNTGILEGVEKYGMEVVGTIYTDGAADTRTYAENLISTYPDMDCLIMASGSEGAAEAAYNRIKAVAGTGSIKLAMLDVPTDAKEMFEDGTLICTCSTIYPLNMYALTLLYNYAKGTPISDKPVYLTQPSLIYTSAEDITEIDTYASNTEYHLWTKEDIQSLTTEVNGDLNEEVYQELMNEWSTDWIKNIISE